MRGRKPALFIAIAFILGVISGNHFNISFVLLFICLLILLVLSFAFYLKKSKQIISFILILSFFLAGFFIHELKTKDFPADHITHFLDLNRKISLSGTVCRDPDIREKKTFLTIDAESILLDEKFIKISGRVLIKIKSSTNRFNYGDYVRVAGYLSTPYSNRNPGAFDYRRYLAQSNIYGVLSIRSSNDIKILFQEKENPFLSCIVYPAKHFILNVFGSTLRGAHQALLSGFVLGERRDIPDEIYKMFTDTGTLHLLAISGSNVGLVVLFFFGFFRLLRFSRRLCILLTLPVIVIFSYVTNNQPSVVRASIMAIIFLLAFFWEREKDLINIIAFAALLILFFSPLSLFDVGFQLSFGVTLGLILFVVYPDSLFNKIALKFKRFFRNWIIFPIFVSLAAQISSYPILAYHFNQISLYAFVANLLVVPLVSLAVITGSLTVIAGLISIKLAQVLSAFNWVVLSLTLKVVEFFSHLPYATVDLPSPSILLLFFYYLFFLVVLINWDKKVKRIGFLSLIFLSIFVLGKEIIPQRDKLEITFLDVGKGQSILIDLPSENKILIDTGSKYRSSDAGERVVVPYLIRKNIKVIDHLILTSSRSQFNGGLQSVLQEVRIKEGIILESSERLTKLLEGNKTTYQVIEEDVDLHQNVKILAYLPDKKMKGCLLILEYRDFRALFLTSEIDGNMLNLLTRKDFHLVSTTVECMREKGFKEMVDFVQPRLIILSNYEHPWDELDPEKKKFRIPFYWTKDKGAIRVKVREDDFKLNWMLGKARSKDFKLR
jgi:competence protein ComEC